MFYQGLEGAASSETPHLGGNITVGDPFTFCPLAWRYVTTRFCVKSVLDLGSGCGNASFFFHKEGLQVLAVDGLAANINRSLYPAVMLDLTRDPINTSVDLVHCQEVVEHIAEQFLGNLLSSLTTGKYILMTHALPGQGGHHHVNEQLPAYWIDHLKRVGCDLLVEDTLRIRKLAALDDACYLANTGLLFCNKSRV
jgi:SAM-dependent methyltransferase